MTATIKITKKGFEECISASNQGVKVKISEVSLGTETYTPSETQTALRNEMQREPISQAIDMGATSVYFAAKFSGELAYQVGEIAFWLDTGTLFGVVSSPNEILNYKAANAHVVQPCTLDLSLLPADSVEVVVGVENLNLLIDLEMMKKTASFVGSQTNQTKQSHLLMQLSERFRLSEKE